MKKRLLLSVGIIIALLGTVTAWMQTSASNALNISPESTLASGEIVVVTPLSSSFTITQGAAQIVTGVELYQIDLGAARFSDLIRVEVILLNPQDVGKVLNNPNAYIDIGVWYEDGNGLHTLTDNTKVSKDPGTRASARMSKTVGNVYIYPSVTMRDTLYILASITTPGGIPPGQQVQLFDLKFYCDVRM